MQTIHLTIRVTEPGEHTLLPAAPLDAFHAKAFARAFGIPKQAAPPRNSEAADPLNPKALWPEAEGKVDAGGCPAADCITDVPAAYRTTGAGDPAGGDPRADKPTAEAEASPRARSFAFQPLRPLRERVRTLILDAAEVRGIGRVAAARALADLETDRPILDWLANGGFEKLLALVLELVKLFASPPGKAL